MRNGDEEGLPQWRQDAIPVPVTLRLADRQSNPHPDLLVLCGAVELWFLHKDGNFVVQ